MAAEPVVSEFEKLEQELKQLYIDLNDTANLNEELGKKIDERDQELSKKDERLVYLKEKNLAELEQLELELQTVKDYYAHEINYHRNCISSLGIHADRLKAQSEENDRLKESINFLSDQLNIDRRNHANDMFEMNQSMLHLRRQMEGKLRKELTGMDVSYQKDAFASLQDKQKKAMFENAKLKDEVALQGVGIVNLGARLGRQRQNYEDCLKKLRKLYKKSQLLRETLGHCHMQKNELQKQKEKLSLQLQQLSNEIDQQHDVLNQGNTLLQLENQYRDAKIKKYEEEGLIVMWKRRRTLFESLHLDIKPVTLQERMGHYDSTTFSLASAVDYTAQHSRPTGADTADMFFNENEDIEEVLGEDDSLGDLSGDPRPAVLAEHSKHSLEGRPSLLSIQQTSQERKASLSRARTTSSADHSLHSHESRPASVSTTTSRLRNLEQLMQTDVMLGKALHPLKGKEGVVLVKYHGKGAAGTAGNAGAATAASGTAGGGGGGGGDSVGTDQNMVAWITTKILDVWESTLSDFEFQLEERVALLDIAQDFDIPSSQRDSVNDNEAGAGGAVAVRPMTSGTAGDGGTRRGTAASLGAGGGGSGGDVSRIRTASTFNLDPIPANEIPPSPLEISSPALMELSLKIDEMELMYDNSNNINTHETATVSDTYSISRSIQSPSVYSEAHSIDTAEDSTSFVTSTGWLKKLPKLQRLPPTTYHLQDSKKPTGPRMKSDLFSQSFGHDVGPPVVTTRPIVEKLDNPEFIPKPLPLPIRRNRLEEEMRMSMEESLPTIDPLMRSVTKHIRFESNKNISSSPITGAGRAAGGVGGSSSALQQGIRKLSGSKSNAQLLGKATASAAGKGNKKSFSTSSLLVK